MRFLTSRSGVQILPGALKLMKIKKVSLSLTVYLALIESISLFVLDFSREFDIYGAFLVGFIPVILVLWIYKLSSSRFPVKINDEKISNLPVVLLSIANGIFIVLLFLIQDLMLRINPHIFVPIFGLFSVFLTFLILVLIYNSINLKVIFNLDEERIKIKKISLYFAIYAGIIEAFILPLMYLFYSIDMPSLLNGFIAGLIGSFIGLVIVNNILSKKPLEISL